MANGLEGMGSHGRRSARLEAVAWVAAWLIRLAGLLAYIYVSEKTILWVWAALLLLALVSPTPSTYRKALRKESKRHSG